MRQSIPHKYGPFVKALNTALSALLIASAAGEAVIAQGCDVATGAVRGFYGPGTALDTAPQPGCKSIAFMGASTWVGDYGVAWACNDAPQTIGGNVYETTYASSHGVYNGGKPVVWLGANKYALGMAGRDLGPGVVNGSSGGKRTYAYTAFSVTTGAESNPTQRSNQVATCRGAALSGIYAEDASLYGTIHRRIYATREGDPDGILYYYATIPNNVATTWVDNGATDFAGVAAGTYEPDDTAPLNWGLGGNIDNDVMPFDHSRPPAFTVIAESMHSVDDSEGSGVQFAADNETVRWSHKGKPWAWPAVQQHRLPEKVEVIISLHAQTFACTQTGVWSFAGAADYAIAPTKTGATHGVRKGFGKTAQATPHGIVYVAREGLALFNGNSTHIITKGVLDPGEFAAYDYGTAAYYDGYYFLALWGSGVVYRFDLSDLENVRVFKDALDVGAFHVTTKTSGAIAGMDKPSLYVVMKTDGTVRPWRPADESNVPGAAPMPWKLRIGHNPLGDANAKKRFLRAKVRGSGDLTIRFYVNGEETAKKERRGTGLFWLPTMEGYTFTWEAESLTGTGVLEVLDVQTEVFHAA